MDTASESYATSRSGRRRQHKRRRYKEALLERNAGTMFARARQERRSGVVGDSNAQEWWASYRSCTEAYSRRQRQRTWFQMSDAFYEELHNADETREDGFRSVLIMAVWFRNEEEPER